ncbi:MAG: stage III sporulation protein AF [Clostridia bacterium]|nr:stage III sporulation protein AF [Clostridia bacterium]
MEWISNWIMQIAGIIVVGAISELIMVEGELKKYVKLVAGLVLMLTVIRPIIVISSNTFQLEIPKSERLKAVELKNRLDEKEMEKIFEIYREKLETSVENEIYSRFGLDVTAKADVEENDENSFGNIIALTVFSDYTDKASDDEIKELLNQKFGVSKEMIEIQRK